MNANFKAAFKIASAAGDIATLPELQFHILNRTPLAVPCDRVSLWQGQKLLGVSGNRPADPRGPFAEAWRRAMRLGKWNAAPVVVSVKNGGPAGEALAGLSPTLEAMRLPLPGTDIVCIVERWEKGFSQDEQEILTSMAGIYAAAWRGRGRRWRALRGRTIAWLAGVAALAAAMFLVRLPLRIVAPCEIVPDETFLVATPMDGVIREVLVRPGEMVTAGQPLARYEEAVASDELAVARLQMETVEAELTALRTRSLSEPSLRGRVSVLEARLEQERARLALAETRWQRMNIVSPVDGMARLQDPDVWRGRPVAIGERLMWVVEPEQNHVRIWLPQSDRLDFDFSKTVRVHLDAFGGELFSATLSRVSDTAQMAPTGVYGFPADAEWTDKTEARQKLGLSGTAVLYGPDAPLGWWLFRKPVTGIRRWLGL